VGRAAAVLPGRRPTNYPTSTSTSANWSRWDTTNNTTFAELRQNLGQDWTVQGTVSYITDKSDSDLLYVYGTPNKLGGGGLYAYPSQYAADQKQTLADMSVDGKFNLGGRQHDLSFGYSWSRSRLNDVSHYGRASAPRCRARAPSTAATRCRVRRRHRRQQLRGPPQHRLPRGPLQSGRRLEAADRPELDARQEQRQFLRHQQVQVGQQDHAVCGRGVRHQQQLVGYASHTEIFNPQSEIDATGTPLDPIEGKTTEAGLKAALFDNKLNASAAIFKTQQDNTAEAAGMIGVKPTTAA
jgi:outer membrane receptor for ferric coprogen and ferric-rhodotorulic acid